MANEAEKRAWIRKVLGIDVGATGSDAPQQEWRPPQPLLPIFMDAKEELDVEIDRLQRKLREYRGRGSRSDRRVRPVRRDPGRNRRPDRGAARGGARRRGGPQAGDRGCPGLPGFPGRGPHRRADGRQSVRGLRAPAQDTRGRAQKAGASRLGLSRRTGAGAAGARRTGCQDGGRGRARAGGSAERHGPGEGGDVLAALGRRAELNRLGNG